MQVHRALSLVEEGDDSVCAVTKPVSFGRLCLDKVSVPKLLFVLKDSIQTPSLSPCPNSGGESVHGRVQGSLFCQMGWL